MSVSNTDFSSRDETIESGKYFYGSEWRDNYLLRDPANFPRYAHLARKMIRHFAGDRYDPHTINMFIEPHIREMIKGLIEYKITYRTKGYDWEWIEEFFKKVVSDYLELGLTYDEKRIEQGFAPEFAAPMLVNYDRPN